MANSKISLSEKSGLD